MKTCIWPCLSCNLHIFKLDGESEIWVCGTGNANSFVGGFADLVKPQQRLLVLDVTCNDSQGVKGQVQEWEWVVELGCAGWCFGHCLKRLEDKNHGAETRS